MNKYLDIVIVSWNNLDSLRTTIESIKRNSSLKNQIYVHLNDGSDGSWEYLDANCISYTRSVDNKGLCFGANSASKLGNGEWVCLVDDDMYMFPEWDLNLLRFYYKHFEKEITWLSSTMIEGKGSQTGIGNIPWTNEEDMLKNYTNYINTIDSVITTQATPALIQREVWEKIGGYPIEFSPALGSDDAICKKLYDIGCRNFTNVPNSLIYHFQGQSTSRSSNDSMKRDFEFRKMFGITISEFMSTLGRGNKWVKQ